ncbi:MAG TPA: ABC transporter ATP-binding protein [Pseudolabrys sp.]|nr:ABC transporter ATP-binding protein [Pseudolabrys sp.]
MSGPVIEAAGLSKRYGTATAVDSVSFTVGAGEIFGLLGPNGAGKTTTILMLLGLSDISGGTARVFGHDPAREPLAVKREVGYLPDSVGFYDNLTAADNLHYTARLIGIPRLERKKRIFGALERVGLHGVAEKRVATFSRGMRQRLGLAEIVMKGARIAILDEPTNGLDPQASLELLDLIRSLKASGVSILLSSHLLDRVQSVCDRVALFNAGQIVLMGTVAELGRQVLGGGFTVEVEAEGGKDIAKRLGALPGVRSLATPEPGRFRLTCERDLRAEAAAAVVAGEGRLKQLSLDQPSLENIYTRYFQGAAQAQEVRDAA